MIMNDDEVLDAVKKTLSDVRMDRPLEAIERRGQVRRRNRRFGLVAGGALAAVAALALAVPLANQASGPSPAGGGRAGGEGPAGASTELKPEAFTLVKQADSTVKLSLNPKQLMDPDALQKALAAADIPAVVKAGVLCTPTGAELPESKQVFAVEKSSETDGSPRYELVIAPAKMPKGSVVYFSVFPVRKGEDNAKFAKHLVTKDAPMNCRAIG
jgi:hypothetical protein